MLITGHQGGPHPLIFFLFVLGCRGCGLSLILAGGGSHCGASLDTEHRLYSAGSAVVACGLSCPMACGIFLDQGSNPCPLHWQVNS